MEVQGSSLQLWFRFCSPWLCSGRVSASNNAGSRLAPSGNVPTQQLTGFGPQVSGIRQFPSGGRAGTRIPTGAVRALGRGGHCCPCPAQPH